MQTIGITRSARPFLSHGKETRIDGFPMAECPDPITERAVEHVPRMATPTHGVSALLEAVQARFVIAS